MKIRKRLLSLVLCVALLVCALPLTAAAEDDFTAVLAEAKKGVVQIYGLINNGEHLGSWIGTGFAVGEKGADSSDVFLTNRHVIDGYDEGDPNAVKYPLEDIRHWILLENCTFNEYGEPDPTKSIPCEILKATSLFPDYGIIRATESTTDYKPLPLMSSKDVADGTKVYALGYPGVVGRASVNHYGIDDMTVTDGIVSQHMQMVEKGNTWVLLNTAQISGGNSGGPLITEDGYVVGLNTYGFGAQVADRSCAVYIDYAMDGLDELDLPYEKIDPNVDPDDPEMTPILIGGGVAVIAAAVALIIARKKKQEKEEEQRRQAEERRRREEEQRRQAEERRRMEEAQRRREEEQRRREEEQRRKAQEVKAQLRYSNGGIYPVTASGCIIGRERDCSVVLPEITSGVSRHHCKVEFRDGQLILTDLNSSCGTYIHGKRVPPNTPVILKSGSSFCLGSEQIKFTVC